MKSINAGTLNFISFTLSIEIILLRLLYTCHHFRKLVSPVDGVFIVDFSLIYIFLKFFSFPLVRFNEFYEHTARNSEENNKKLT